jgi:hypothetical protein
MLPLCLFAAWGLDCGTSRGPLLRGALFACLAVWSINELAAFRIDPRAPETRLNSLVTSKLGMADRRAGAERLVGDQPKYLPGKDYLAELYLQTGRLDGGRRLLEQLPDSPRRQFLWAMLQEREHLTAEALGELRDALHRGPDNMESASGLLRLLKEHQTEIPPQDVIDGGRMVLGVMPKVTDAHALVAAACRRAGDEEQATLHEDYVQRLRGQGTSPAAE